MSDVIVSRLTGAVYHNEFCPYAKRISRNNVQIIDKYVAEKRGYHQCKYCFSAKGYVNRYQGIYGFETSYDPVDDALCIKTPVGFWKIMWDKETNERQVFHMNHKGYKCFDPNLKSHVLMRGAFHKQKDLNSFRSEYSLEDIFEYIRKHDHILEMTGGDYKKMPRNTRQQRRFYRQAKNRERRKSIRTVYKILDKLSNDTEVICNG